MIFIINLKRRRLASSENSAEMVLRDKPKGTGIFGKVFGFIISACIIGTMEIALGWVANKVRTVVWDMIEGEKKEITVGGTDTPVEVAA